MKGQKVPDGFKGLYAVVPQAAWEALQAVLAVTGRPLSAEVTHAIERHAAHPPRVVAPPLPAAEAVHGSGRHRGRPRKPRPGW